MSKTLVAYFSASGCTAKLAQRLAVIADADLFEIVPEQPYTSADLNWQDKRSRSSVEMADPSSRPAISSELDGIEAYDTVLLGFPIWWYVAPTIINTFLESYDFSGKKIALFATSGSSGMGETAKVLEPCAPGATWLAGKRFETGASSSEIARWIGELEKLKQ